MFDVSVLESLPLSLSDSSSYFLSVYDDYVKTFDSSLISWIVDFNCDFNLFILAKLILYLASSLLLLMVFESLLNYVLSIYDILVIVYIIIQFLFQLISIFTSTLCIYLVILNWRFQQICPVLYQIELQNNAKLFCFFQCKNHYTYIMNVQFFSYY